MPRALTALLTLAALSAAPAAAAKTAMAPASYPPPSTSERLEARREFLEDALRTVSDRSGDIFFLPRKYNFISPVGPEKKNLAHFVVNGRRVQITHSGVSHSAPWTYDRDIPLVFWGPGFVPAGKTVTARAAQQDIVPTYAKLIGCPLPADARGRVLDEALLPTGRKPKVILTVLFDQGGKFLYRSHPGATPFVDRLMREGTSFANARVSHLDHETALGHVAVGTGAYPMDTGIPSNEFWHDGRGADIYSFWGPEGPAPYFEMSPSLGDTWLHYTHNKALLMSYCYADRAAMGMAGHGAFYEGNKKPWVYFLDTDTGVLTTNTRYYAIPEAAKGESLPAFVKRRQGASPTWLGHTFKRVKDFLASPYLAPWEGEHLVRVLEAEPFGADDVPDLIYVTLKSTDATGHIYGQESEEAGQVLAEQDRQLEKLVRTLEKKVGRNNLVVAVSADHGGPPLPELTGGDRLVEHAFLKDLNERFDRTDDGFPVVQYVSGTQLWFNRAQMRANHVSLDDIKHYLEEYEVGGKPFFETVYTREELSAIRRLDLLPAP